MMNNLYINEGDMVWLENVSLPSATFARFQPQSVDFLEITNPKALYPSSHFYRILVVHEIPYAQNLRIKALNFGFQ